MVMRLPIQLWLPELAPNLALPEVQRDRQRAMTAWRGESIVWLLPQLDRPVRWVENPQARFLALPSEHLDKIEVHHIGTNGRASGPGSKWRFPGGRIDSLLSQWLNLDKLAPIDMAHVPEMVPIKKPVFENGQFKGYEEGHVRVAPLYTYPIVHSNESGSNVTIQSPSSAQSWNSVSPDTETIESPYGGQWTLEHDEKGFPTYVNERAPGMRTFITTLRWPEPFRNLMPICSGFDEMDVQQRMAAIAAASRSRAEQALADALNESAQLVWRASASIQMAEFSPILADEGAGGLLIHIGCRYGKEASSMKELAQVVSWKEFMGRQIEVRGVWGAVGLLWALLLDELESRRAFGACEICGRIIPKPRVDKRFCSQEDNVECFRQRNTAAQRASRRRARPREETPKKSPGKRDR